MNAVQLLANEHRSIDDHFGEFELGEASPAEREDLVRVIVDELRAHGSLEEDLLYPDLAAAAPAERIIDVVLAEHDVVEMILLELDGLSKRDKDFEAKVSVLIDTVRAHMRREETEVLPLARRLLGDEHLTEIGDAMLARQEGQEA